MIGWKTSASGGHVGARGGTPFPQTTLACLGPSAPSIPSLGRPLAVHVFTCMSTQTDRRPRRDVAHQQVHVRTLLGKVRCNLSLGGLRLLQTHHRGTLCKRAQPSRCTAQVRTAGNRITETQFCRLQVTCNHMIMVPDHFHGPASNVCTLACIQKYTWSHSILRRMPRP